MRSLRWIFACLIAGALAAASCHAADNGVYAGGSLGQARMDLSGDLDRVLDGEDTAFKLIVGLRPLDWLGVERQGRLCPLGHAGVGEHDLRPQRLG